MNPTKFATIALLTTIIGFVALTATAKADTTRRTTCGTTVVKAKTPAPAPESEMKKPAKKANKPIVAVVFIKDTSRGSVPATVPNGAVHPEFTEVTILAPTDTSATTAKGNKLTGERFVIATVAGDE